MMGDCGGQGLLQAIHIDRWRDVEEEGLIPVIAIFERLREKPFLNGCKRNFAGCNFYLGRRGGHFRSGCREFCDGRRLEQVAR